MASRSLDDLAPQTRLKIDAWLCACVSAGLDLLVTSTYRSFKEQDAIYAQGRSKPGKIVTNARGGSSYHNVRRALDFVPILAGKPDWTDDNPQLHAAGKLAAKFKLVWGGTWKKKDWLHVEDTYCDFCKSNMTSSQANHFDENGDCRIAVKMRARAIALGQK